MKTLSCPNKACLLASARSIICYGFYNTNSGKRRRYRCRSSGKTFCANTGTPYHRLQHRRTTSTSFFRLFLWIDSILRGLATKTSFP
jgi:hypothetical protein